VALGPALGPIVQDIKNTVNSQYAYVYPDPVTMALGVAQGQVPEKTARQYASYHGFGDDAMTALIEVANVGPQLGQAFEAWRRINPATGKSYLSDAQFQTALKRTGLEPQWYPAIMALKGRLLEPADLARAIHRGLIPDPGLLQGRLPSGVGNVPAYPVYPIDAEQAAAGYGYTLNELGVLVGLQGNPMGSHEAAQAYFRQVLTEDDYLRAVSEGNTRNEWADAIQEQSRAIPSPTNYVEGFVRNWITKQQMYDGAARHGMTETDTDLLFLNHGRPLSWHQTFIGLRRGGVYDGPTDDIDPAFLKSLQESNIRPEWYNLAWAQRFTYPAAFVLKALTTSGDLTAAEAETILLYEGWEPTLAAKVSAAWGGGTAAVPGKKLTVTQVKQAWKTGQLTDAQVLADLATLKYSPGDAQTLLDTWKATPAPTKPAG
jgi:hypothetical protein